MVTESFHVVTSYQTPISFISLSLSLSNCDLERAVFIAKKTSCWITLSLDLLQR